jgi:hypothetical protein
VSGGTSAMPGQPAGQAAPGPAAPYYGGYSAFEYGPWSYGSHNRYNELKWRYDRTRDRVKRVRDWYRRGSYERRAVDNQLDHGEQLWKQYRRSMNASSAWHLEVWIQQWENYLSQYGYGHDNGWYNGGYYNGGYQGGYTGWQVGGSWGNGGWSVGGGVTWDNGYYRYPDYGYYDTSSRWYYGNNVPYGYYGYGGNDAYINGLALGNSIGHIVTGSRYDNNLELIGGILGTAGSTINIINGARY